MFDLSRYTLGCELELGDVDTKVEIPDLLGQWDYHDSSICNSNGTANDPKRLLNRYGGEIQVAPTEDTKELVKRVFKIYKLFKKMDMNFTTNLHMHIRVPGLRKNLKTLKKLAAFIDQCGTDIFNLIDPIPVPHHSEHSSVKSFRGAWARYKRRQRSHHTIPSRAVLTKLLEAKTTKEFHEAYAPKNSSGKPQWHLVQRSGINLAHLWKNDCIEFRCFTMTDSKELLKNAINFPYEFLKEALVGQVGASRFEELRYQEFWPYDYKKDKIFQLTNVRHNSRALAAKNYEQLIQNGTLSKRDIS